MATVEKRSRWRVSNKTQQKILFPGQSNTKTLLLDASSAAKLLFVLFTETVSYREEVPTPLLIHVPDVRFLAGIFRVRFIDQMH